MKSLNARWRDYQAQGLQRTRVVHEDHLIQFASNDYLGLAHHPSTIATLQQQLPTMGYGSGASAYVSGFHPLQADVEQQFADYLGFDDALLFNTGYLANLGVMECLLQKDSALFIDRECHASMIDGMRLAQGPAYRFRDVAHLQQLLAQSTLYPCIATESVFSQSGQCSDITALKKLSRGLLMVDDAHGFGVLHPKGIVGLQSGIDLLVIPCGKALGAFGGMVLGSHEVIGYLKQFSRTAIYTTALPPICLLALLSNLQILKTETYRGEQLRANRDYFNQLITEYALPMQLSQSAIFQMPVKSNKIALHMVDQMKTQGFVVCAMRQPTVPTPCLRITLSALHDPAILQRFAATLSREACDVSLD